MMKCGRLERARLCRKVTDLGVARSLFLRPDVEPRIRLCETGAGDRRGGHSPASRRGGED